jgi:hypothetical protein
VADFTLSDMPATLSRVDTAGTVDGSSSAPFGGIGGVVPRSGGSVYVKGPTVTFSVYDSGTSTYKTIEIPSIRRSTVPAIRPTSAASSPCR